MILIGEKLHSMYPKIDKAVKGRDPAPIVECARTQAEAGADYLDLNLCTVMKDVETAMAWAVEVVQKAVKTPIVLDIPNHKAMAAGLRVCQNEAVINGVCGTMESKTNMYPLAQQYGTDVIMILYTDQTAPRNADERSLLTMELVAYANELGIPPEKIWVDLGVYPLANNQEQVSQGLEFLQLIQDVAPGVKTIAGVSNVSALGPPSWVGRVLNQTYCVIAQRYGLHAAIVNVLDNKIVRLNRCELPEITQLIHRVMDGEGIAPSDVQVEAAAYVTATRMLLGKEPYSLSAFKL